MATPQDKTVSDRWESRILARILMHHTVIIVTRPELKSLTVIPNGISVIVG